MLGTAGRATGFTGTATSTASMRALAARRLLVAAVSSPATAAPTTQATQATVQASTGTSSSSSLVCAARRSYSTTSPILYSFDRGTSGSPFSSMGSSSPGSGGGGGDGTGAFEVSRWPLTKSNTILNIVPQGKRFVVERFGKLSAIHDSGYFFAIPFVDNIGELQLPTCRV